MFVGVSCVCVSAKVYVCICHSRDREKMFLVSKDKIKVLSLEYARTYENEYNLEKPNSLPSLTRLHSFPKTRSYRRLQSASRER